MIKSKQAVIDVQADALAVAKRAASWLIEQLQKSDTDRFSLCLSGGQTPKLLYKTLAQPEYSKLIPWSKVHLFWGDERFVPQDNDLSNYKMVKTTLLDHVPLPKENVHAVNTSIGDVYQVAQAYEKDLQEFYGSKTLVPHKCLFDATLLGVGSDGHTASLFPGHFSSEENVWAKAVVGVKQEARITLTIPVLESSRAVAFLATGAEKSSIIKQVLDGDGDLPAAKIKPEGNLFWFLDQTAYLSGSIAQ
jgi:6-phosphogluconolactonase